MSYDRRSFKRPDRSQKNLMDATAATAEQAVGAAEGVLAAAKGIKTMLGGATLPDKDDLAKVSDLIDHYKKGANLLARITAILENNVKDLKSSIT